MSYESWRISYQSSEQAARAAFDEIATLRAQLAAGYARGLAEGRERCAVEAWMYYMDTCKRNGIGPDVYPQWCCAAALRGEVKP